MTTAATEQFCYACHNDGRHDPACPHGRIILWPFENAPEQYKALSSNGGDEDWIMLVPAELVHVGKLYRVADALDTCNEPECHILDSGAVVYIGAHA